MDGQLARRHTEPCEPLRETQLEQAREQQRIADLEDHRRRLNGSIDRLSLTMDKHMELVDAANRATETKLLHAIEEVRSELTKALEGQAAALKSKADAATVTDLQGQIKTLTERILWGAVAVVVAQAVLKLFG